MRISHSDKWIFLAVPRTGSTTVRKLLDDYSDIRSIHITKISKEFPFYHHISALELKNIFEIRGWKWEDYTKFCIVRNPFDRIVSLYYHHLKMRKNVAKKSFLKRIKDKVISEPSFEDFVFQINPGNRLTTSLKNFICDQSGNVLVDDILKFENLESDIPKYLNKLSTQINIDSIPHLNASKGRLKYRKYYGPDTKKKIAELYYYEIEKFAYSF